VLAVVLRHLATRGELSTIIAVLLAVRAPRNNRIANVTRQPLALHCRRRLVVDANDRHHVTLEILSLRSRVATWISRGSTG